MELKCFIKPLWYNLQTVYQIFVRGPSHIWRGQKLPISQSQHIRPLYERNNLRMSNSSNNNDLPSVRKYHRQLGKFLSPNHFKPQISSHRLFCLLLCSTFTWQCRSMQNASTCLYSVSETLNSNLHSRISIHVFLTFCWIKMPRPRLTLHLFPLHT